MSVNEPKKMSEHSAGVRNAAKTHKLLAELVTLSPNPKTTRTEAKTHKLLAELVTLSPALQDHPNESL
jgi:hypothetical protein